MIKGCLWQGDAHHRFFPNSATFHMLCQLLPSRSRGEASPLALVPPPLLWGLTAEEKSHKRGKTWC